MGKKQSPDTVVFSKQRRILAEARRREENRRKNEIAHYGYHDEKVVRALQRRTLARKERARERYATA